jgi:hypothetical protein
MCIVYGVEFLVPGWLSVVGVYARIGSRQATPQWQLGCGDGGTVRGKCRGCGDVATNSPVSRTLLIMVLSCPMLFWAAFPEINTL